MTMARALSVTHVLPNLHTPNDVRSLSRKTFDQNFMKLGHIVKYHADFFKLDNGPYHTMLSVVMPLCL